MNKVRNLLLTMLLLLPSISRAQFFKVDYDKKVIYTDSLNLPDNSAANSVLYLLPELLQRPGTNISTYDIKINDMSLGSSADAVLIQLSLLDIEKIEVNESPTSSYQNNGQGGSINLILRDKSQIEDSKHPNLFGTLGMSAEYPLDLTPNLHLGYKNKKFTLHTLAVGEWYNNNEDKSVHIINDHGFNTDAEMDIATRFYSQLVRVYTKYAPTDNDFIKFNLSEASTSNRIKTTQDNPVETRQNSRNSSTTLQTLFNYKHIFRPHCELETEFQYIYSPARETYLDSAVCDYHDRMRTHNVSGKVEFKTPLVHEMVFTDPNNRHFADITTGVRVNGVFLSEDISNEDLRPQSTTHTVLYENPSDNSFFLMPYAQLEAGLGKFRFKAVGEYQHYEYHIHRQGESYDHNKDDFTGKLMLEWHFTQDHQLRLIFDRQIIRPSDDQIFPYMRYNTTYMAYVQGVDLPTSGVQEVKMDYVGFIRMPHRQNLMLNAAISYNNVSDIVQSYKTGGNTSSGALGLTQEYYTFNHDGRNKLINADFMARYTYKAFSFAFTGNLTHLFNDNGTETDEFTFYNLSVTPSVYFKHGWSASFNARYFSRIYRNNLRSGDYGLLALRIGKDIGPVNVNVFGSIAPGGRVHDITYATGSHTITSYISETNCVGVGVHWKF